MRLHLLACLPILTVALGATPSNAAQAVQADVVLHTTRVQPTHQLVETLRVEVPYGSEGDTFGFVPRGQERVAVGPSAFDVDASGVAMVADPVRGKVFRLGLEDATPRLAARATLPLPFAAIALDRDGRLHVADLKTRSIGMIGSSRRVPLPGSAAGLRWVRLGRDLVIGSGGARQRVLGGALTPTAERMDVEKCNAEAGLVTLPDGRQVQVEIGAPLASIRLIGANETGDVFLIVEQFRQRGRLEVSRSVLVLDASGRLKAERRVIEQPAVDVEHDFVLSPSGALYRMIPANDGVTFVRWEVRR